MSARFRWEEARFLPFAWTMLTADLVGCAAGVLDDAVAYVQDRRQFGVPVGSFQAVQHLGAGAFVLVEAIRSSRFYILTSSHRDQAMRRRAEEILAGGPPAPPFPQRC